MKAWLEKYGFHVPETSKVGSIPLIGARQESNTSQREELVAAVRRNSRIAYLKQQDATQTASESVQSAFADLTNSMIDTWSESQLKEFCDKNGITGTSQSFMHTSHPASVYLDAWY